MTPKATVRHSITRSTFAMAMVALVALVASFWTPDRAVGIGTIRNDD